MRTERANAKINLYLDIVSRRPNGYHNLVSIMQTVSLCDLVTVEFRPQPTTVIRLSASGNADMPTDCRNLAWKAAERYLEATDRRGSVTIYIEKHIPMAAGLAGGSSDAAAVLRALNHLCGNALTTEELCALGSKLGADVPFCIVGGMSYVTGVGECLEPIPSMQRCPMVVACMGEGVSTVWAYGKLDEAHNDFDPPKEEGSCARELARHLQNGEIGEAGALFYNLFEEVVPTVQPCVEPLKATMREYGAIRSMMSGSGPSVFGIFENLSDAERAAKALEQMGAAAFVCHPCAEYRI